MEGLVRSGKPNLLSALGSTLALATVLVAMVFSTKPAAAQSSGIDPRGVYVGSYICRQRQMSAQLTIESLQSSAVEGAFSFYAPGGDPTRPLGSFRMTGSFNFGDRVASTAPRRVDNESGRRHSDSNQWECGTAGRRITGTIPAPGCSTLELTRDEEASRRLLSQSTERLQQVAAAPGFFQARTQEERCQALAKWYSRFRSEYVQVDAEYSRMPADTLLVNGW